MLKLTVQLAEEEWDDENEVFIDPETFVLELEHSLLSLSKWESEFEKPYLGKDPKTEEMVIGYIRAMIISPEYPPDILDRLSQDNIREIDDYINAKMTATWFAEQKNAPMSREVITNELIYYWMTSAQIPWEAQYWHLNRLFTLIKVFGAKNEKPKKKSGAAAASDRAALNAKRRAEMGSNG